MNAGKFLVTVALFLTLAGCRTNPNIALLERELRMQEDEINQLKWSLEDRDTEIRELQRGNGGVPPGVMVQTPYPSSMPPPPRSNSHIAAPDTSGIPPGAVMEPPAVEVPKEFVPEGEIPETLRPRSQRQPSEIPPAEGQPIETPRELPSIDSGHRSQPAPGDGPTLEGPQARSNARRLPVVRGDSRQVAKILLNPHMTGGFRSNGQPSDDGLAVVIEPRDTHGRLVEAAGDIRVDVVDPSVPGPTGRIGRWDFTAADAKQLFRNDAIQGIQLEVPWPDAPPKSNNLHLYVGYKTADGRKLQTDRPIQLDLAAREPRRLPINDASGGEGPALLATRRPENWKAAATPLPPKPIPLEVARDGVARDGIAPKDAAPPTEDVASRPRPLAERRAPPRQGSDEDAPLVAARPAPPKPKAPTLQRPVWSPERP